MEIRCFVDVDGQIWSINANGESNYPADIEIIDDTNTVRILGAYENDSESELLSGRLIEDEYTLWPSLTKLALQLEQQPSDFSDDQEMTLDFAVAETFQKVMAFKSEWISSNKDNPDNFPLALPNDNAGTWFEQLANCILE